MLLSNVCGVQFMTQIGQSHLYNLMRILSTLVVVHYHTSKGYCIPIHLQCETIEGLNAGLRTAIEETQRKLQELKDKREDVEQDIGRIKEEISLW